MERPELCQSLQEHFQNACSNADLSSTDSLSSQLSQSSSKMSPSPRLLLDQHMLRCLDCVCQHKTPCFIHCMATTLSTYIKVLVSQKIFSLFHRLMYGQLPSPLFRTSGVVDQNFDNNIAKLLISNKLPLFIALFRGLFRAYVCIWRSMYAWYKGRYGLTKKVQVQYGLQFPVPALLYGIFMITKLIHLIY